MDKSGHTWKEQDTVFNQDTADPGSRLIGSRHPESHRCECRRWARGFEVQRDPKGFADLTPESVERNHFYSFPTSERLRLSGFDPKGRGQIALAHHRGLSASRKLGGCDSEVEV